VKVRWAAAAAVALHRQAFALHWPVVVMINQHRSSGTNTITITKHITITTTITIITTIIITITTTIITTIIITITITIITTIIITITIITLSSPDPYFLL
jgi:hypothetical protein